MDPLEEGWLSIELKAIDEEVADWGEGIEESFRSLSVDEAKED